MKKKVNIGDNSIFWFGAAGSAGMGLLLIFLSVATISKNGGITMDEEVTGLFWGVLMLALSVVLLVIPYKKIKRAKNLVAAGRYVWAKVIDIGPDYTQSSKKSMQPIALKASYTDPRGTIHTFRFSSSKLVQDLRMVGQPVKVYYEDETFRYYYIDLESIYVSH